MDYTSTLETLEDFWMRLSWCFEHQVGAWAILYPLVIRLVDLVIAHGSQQQRRIQIYIRRVLESMAREGRRFFGPHPLIKMRIWHLRRPSGTCLLSN